MPQLTPPPHSQDRSLHYVTRGEGTHHLVLLHGLTGSHLNWNKLAHELKHEVATTAFDFIGHAKSSAPDQPEAYQTDAVLSDIDQFVTAPIQTSPQKKAILCGLSMGAAAMLQYTLKNPENVEALILTSYPPARQLGGLSAIADAFGEAILSEGLESAGERYVWGENGLFTPRDAQLIRQGFMMHPHPHGLAFCMKEFLAKLPGPDELCQQVASLNLPILMIAGGQDTPSLDISTKLAAALSNRPSQYPPFHFEVIEKGGHLVNIDSVKPYNAVVRTFLTEIGVLAEPSEY